MSQDSKCKNCGASLTPMTIGNEHTSQVVISCPKGCGVLAFGVESLFEHVDRARSEHPSWVPMPGGADLYRTGTRCDMLIGPCACGATHTVEQIAAEVIERDRLREAIRRDARGVCAVCETPIAVRSPWCSVACADKALGTNPKGSTT